MAEAVRGGTWKAITTVVWPMFRPHKWLLILAVALNALHGIAVSTQLLAPKWLIDDIIVKEGISNDERWRLFAWLAAGYLAMTVVGRMLVWHVSFRMLTWIREQAVLGLRARFFRHVNHLCLRWHGQHSSGELFSYLFGSPLGNITNFYQLMSLHAGASTIIILSTLVTTWAWDPVLSGILIVTVFFNVITMRQAQRRIHDIHRDYQESEKEVVGTVSDLLRGNRAVKLYSMERAVATDFDKQASVISRKSYYRDVQGHVEWMKTEALSYVAMVVLMGACVWRHQSGAVSPGVITAVLMAFIGLQAPIAALFQCFTAWGSASASMERIQEVFDAASTTPDPSPLVTHQAPPEEGAITFQDVTFSYGPDAIVLRDFTLTIPFGQRVAFVGPSGAGKSTVSQLILRLYDPEKGEISLGGVNLRRFCGPELRRRFGVVPQDPFMFRTNIRDNVRVARPEADDASIRKALELANAWEFVSRLPEGLDTKVGEGGASLSGGQRQRLSIARALLADSRFFIFDEATSALDTLSEDLIQRALDQVLRGRTAIIIAHRLATVKNCDRIVVIDSGRVAQDGSYDELVRQPGLFRELVEGQRLRA